MSKESEISQRTKQDDLYTLNSAFVDTPPVILSTNKTIKHAIVKANITGELNEICIFLFLKFIFSPENYINSAQKNCTISLLLFQ